MAVTYEPIATYTVPSPQASYTFTTISGAYTDIRIIASVKNNTAASDLLMQFNGDTTANYSYTYMTGTGSSAASGRGSTTPTSIVCDWSAAVPVTSNVFSVHTIDIMNYANTTTYKTALIRAGSANSVSAGTDAIVGLWRKTPEAITSVLLKPSANSFDTGSTFTLYGIKAA